MPIDRRELLTTSAVGLIISMGSARARTIAGGLPWEPAAGSPPAPVRLGPWQFFTPQEGAAVEAIVDRLIPPDPQFPGGKDAGCAVFIDRQLAGPYGSAQGLYMRPPFMDGTSQQGNQSPLTPAERYRQGLAALDKYCRAAYAGKPFAQLSASPQIHQAIRPRILVLPKSMTAERSPMIARLPEWLPEVTRHSEGAAHAPPLRQTRKGLLISAVCKAGRCPSRRAEGAAARRQAARAAAAPQ